LSPNGRWLAYVSEESKRSEVYVQTFPTIGGKWQVSTLGGDHPVWRRDGEELFYIAADGKMTGVEVKSGPNFEAGRPKPLFEARFGGNGFDVAKDGRFLIPVLVDAGVTAPLTVVVGWHTPLTK